MTELLKESNQTNKNYIKNYTISGWEDENLDLNPSILRGIYANGFEKPSAIQKQALYPMIHNKKDGKRRDIIAQAQSGTGKTGAFSIGTLEIIDNKLASTQALILSPTHELAKQIYEVITELSRYMNLTIAKVIGKTNISDSITELRHDPQIIIATPGRLLDMINRNIVYTNKLKTFVIDEADEMLSSGFMESIYNIIKCIPKTTQICLFSATLPPEILQLTEYFMKEPESILVNRDQLTLEGIKQFYVQLEQYRWKFDVLFDIYDTINIAQCIIYVNSKSILQKLYDRLRENDFPVSYIHGSMEQRDRESNLSDFKKNMSYGN